MPDFSGFGNPNQSPSPKPNPVANTGYRARGLHGDARDFLASHLGAGPKDDPGSRKYHANIMEKLTRMGGMTPGGPISSGLLALLAGMENELVGGATEVMQGRPFISDKGFDPVDLDANLTGVTRGIKGAFSPPRGFIPPR